MPYNNPAYLTGSSDTQSIKEGSDRANENFAELALPNKAALKDVQENPQDSTAGRLIPTEYGYYKGNILGTVSQSGGVPTGAIIERGSNSDGEYVKFADGTYIVFSERTVTDVSIAGGAREEIENNPSLPLSVISREYHFGYATFDPTTDYSESNAQKYYGFINGHTGMFREVVLWNSGRNPASYAPPATPLDSPVTSNTAQSYRYSFICVGRWW